MAKPPGDDWVAFTFRLPPAALKRYKAAAEEYEKTLGGQVRLGLSAWLRMAADEKLERQGLAAASAVPKKGDRR